MPSTILSSSERRPQVAHWDRAAHADTRRPRRRAYLARQDLRSFLHDVRRDPANHAGSLDVLVHGGWNVRILPARWRDLPYSKYRDAAVRNSCRAGLAAQFTFFVAAISRRPSRSVRRRSDLARLRHFLCLDGAGRSFRGWALALRPGSRPVIARRRNVVQSSAQRPACAPQMTRAVLRRLSLNHDQRVIVSPDRFAAGSKSVR
jgi:hypothetical protein